jgi:hypothetical protein
MNRDHRCHESPLCYAKERGTRLYFVGHKAKLGAPGVIEIWELREHPNAGHPAIILVRIPVIKLLRSRAELLSPRRLG